MVCWRCKKNVSSVETFSRRSVCPHCNADLHVCKACAFYEVGAQYDCHETVDECVTDKERANFCDYFLAKTNVPADAQNGTQKKSRAAFDALFSSIVL